MRKNAKRWIAFLLAVIMVATTCMYQSDSFLWATGDNGAVEDTAVTPAEETQVVTLPGNTETAVSTDMPTDVAGTDQAVENPAEPMVGSETPPAGTETGEQPEDVASEAETGSGEENTPTDQTPAANDQVSGTATEETEQAEETETDTDQQDTESQDDVQAVEKPAQTLSVSVNDGAAVNVTAPDGVLPEGASVTSQTISEETVVGKFADAARADGNELTGLKIYDISILNKEGVEIQPDGTVTVAISGTGLAGNRASLYHANDADSDVTKVCDLAGADSVEFQADHFSFYGIAVFADAEEEKPSDEEPAGDVPAENEPSANDEGTTGAEEEEHYYTVVFQYADPSQEGASPVTIVSQTVKENDTLEFPSNVKAFAGYYFAGWKTDAGVDVTAETPVTGNMTVNACYNKIGKYTVTINYLYSDRMTVAAQPYVAEIENGVEFHKTVTSPKVEGFTADQESVTVDVTDSTSVTYDVIYAGEAVEYKVIHKLEGISGELEDQIAETETLTGEIGIQTNAVAKEYEGFTAEPAGNYTLSAGGNPDITIVYKRNLYVLNFNTGDNGSYIMPETLKFGQKIDYPGGEAVTKPGYDFMGWNYTETTMPAHDLTVMANWQAATRADYTVVYWQEKVPGTYDESAGTQYDFKESDETRKANVGDSATYATKSYEGFELNAEKSNVEVKVAADGSTVKNVYYDRKIYTIKFYEYERSGWFGGNWKEIPALKITAKFGEDISDVWNDSAHKPYVWKDSETGKMYAGFFNMPASDLEMHSSGRKSGSKTATYYVESLNDNTQYDIKQVIEKLNYANLTEEDAQPIEGFTFKEWINKNPFKLYYVRNSYNLVFENCKNPSVSVKYEDSIFDKLPEHPTPADGIDSDYQFDGWYYSPAYSTEVGSDATMPAHNVQVYAKWIKPTYKVTLHFNDDNDGTEVIEKEKYYTISPDALSGYAEGLTKKDYEFTGWYTDAACTKPFTEGMKVVGPTDLYAGWKQTSGEYSYSIICRYEGEDQPFQTIADNKGPVNGTVTVTAPAVEEGFATTTSKSVVLDQDGKTVEFIYRKVAQWSYTVKYLDQDGKELAESVKRQTTKGVVTEEYVAIENYNVDSVQKSLAKDGNGEIVFHYTPFTKANYEIHYLFEKADGTGYETREDVPAVKDNDFVGNVIVAEEKTFDGFECVTTLSGRTLLVRKNGTNVVEVKYDRVTVGYTVNYVAIDDSTKVLHESKKGSAKYGQTITAENEKIAIDGYMYVKAEPEEITIGLTEYDNVLTLYYRMPEMVTVTPKSDTKPYNGEEQTVSGFVNEVEEMGIKIESQRYEGDFYVRGLTASAAGTEPDTYDVQVNGVENLRVVQILNDTERDVTEWFDVAITKASLIITADEKAIVITANSNSWGYDGESHSDSGYTVTYDGEKVTPNADGEVILPTGGKVTAVIEGSVTNVADVSVVDGIVQPNNIVKSYSVDKFYTNVTTENGTLTITPRVITIVSETASKPYDGTALTRPDVTYQDGKGFIGEEATAAATGKVTTVAEGEVTNTIVMKPGTGYVEENYNINREEGTLEITQASMNDTLKLTGNDVTHTYDGEEHAAGTATVTANDGRPTDDLTIEYCRTGTEEWTTDPSEIKEINAGETIIDVRVSSPNYSGELTATQKITINKRNLVLTSATLEKVYDGKELTNDGAAVTANEGTDEGWAKEEDKLAADAYEFSGGQTLVGSTDNAFAIEADQLANIEKNYNVELKFGTLTVTDKDENGDKVNDGLVVGKDHEPSTNEDGKFRVGDTVTFQITVTNIYKDAKDVTLTEIPGVEFADVADSGNAVTKFFSGVKAFFTGEKGETHTINLAGGETRTVEATYVITEADIVKGSFTNTVFATMKDSEGQPREYTATDTVGNGSDRTEFESVNAHITLEKTVVDPKDLYEPGDTVTYQITAANNGNLTLENIHVEDALVGKTGDNAWTIDQIAPGETKDLGTVTYTVKDTDASEEQSSTLTNTASVFEKNITYGETIVPLTCVDGTARVSIAQNNPSLAIIKEVNRGEDGNGKAGDFAVGEEIPYTITVTNNGNVTVSNITVEDVLVKTNGNEVIPDVALTSDTLAPGTSATAEVIYTVTEADVIAGSVVNTAAASGTTAAGETVSAGPAECTVRTAALNTNFTVSKQIVDKKDEYKVGETIQYQITVTSQANVTLENLKVTDQLSDAAGTITFGTLPEGVRVDGNDPKALIIETLAPNATVTLECSYTPARGDAGKEIGNTATVTAAVPTKDGTKEKIVNASSDKAQIEKLYQLTIHYVYEDKSKAADDVVEQYLAGETYTYTSPDITGYTPDLTVVKSVGTGMPKYDVVVMVTYTANDQTYTVNYLEAGANEVLHDPAENKSAKFDQVIDGSREAILIDGYEFDHADPASLTVGTDNTKNVINVYYTKRADLHYEIHYYYDGTEAEDQNVVVNDAIFDAEIPYEANLTGQHDGKSYVLDYAAKTQGQSETRIAWVTGDTTKTVQKETVNVTVAPTVIKVYYLLDENGPDHVPDNIPDAKEYHVTYDGNGGMTKLGEASVTDPAVYPAGYTSVYAAPENQFTKADAVFAYWKVAGTDEIIQADEPFQMADSDMTLIAQWKQLTVSKNAGTPTDADGNEKDVFELNDEIPFTIVVKNSGDVALQNVVVTDELEGAVINGGSGYTVTDNTAVIASLAAGAEVTVNAHYVVTEDEIGRNDVTNTAKAEAEAEGTTGSDTTDPIPMDEVEKQLTVTKEVTNEDEATGTDAQGNQAFTAGDTIEFAITVKNTGNQTLEDIVVEDTLEGAEITGGNLLTNLFNRLVSGYTVEDGKAVIASLKPGESITVTATYVVKEADLGNPNFRNTVTATAGDNTPGTGTTDPIPVEEKNPEYTLTKQVVDAKDEYAPGEEIVYTIVVTNTGNQTLTEVEVTDHLPVVFDEEQLEAESAEVIAADENGVTVRFDEIGIGETKTLTATYTVTEADVLYGSVTNVATAAGKDPEDKPVDPKDPDDGEVTTDTVDPVTDYTVTKTITNPQPQYNVGDTIRYAITVASQANITLENVVVTDQLTDATGVVTFTEVNGATVNADNTVTIAALAPGATVTLNCEYTITREDAGRNIINTATATTDPVIPTDPENPDPIDPGEEESDPTDPAVIENLYNLTIHYVYAAGGTAAPDVTAQFLAGETFTYDSPAIDGYTPDYAFLRSSAEGMPARDVELTVVYTAIPGPAVYVPGTPVIPGVPPTPVPIADAPAAIAALPVPAGTAVPVIPVITIPDDPVPLAGGEITADDEEDDVVIVPVDDPEVPLAGPGDMHHCCILHFLLMLAAVVVYMFYSDDMRRRQKKIAGLTDEYGRETMKRR